MDTSLSNVKTTKEAWTKKNTNSTRRASLIDAKSLLKEEANINKIRSKYITDHKSNSTQLNSLRNEANFLTLRSVSITNKVKRAARNTLALQAAGIYPVSSNASYFTSNLNFPTKILLPPSSSNASTVRGDLALLSVGEIDASSSGVVAAAAAATAAATAAAASATSSSGPTITRAHSTSHSNSGGGSDDAVTSSSSSNNTANTTDVTKYILPLDDTVQQQGGGTLHKASEILHLMSIAITCLFVVLVAIKIACMGRKFFKNRNEVSALYTFFR
ncbi:unnamed protein product [Protopolystoma xenopodis]|uniref:Uncharacterized protein n=1 Tax=Protopolystoma xenopodis TaxID=117903 RepID=A0A448WJM8_9PLAT|nr:unnamed protein product [Protopolystoma xenopodis]